MLVLDGKRQIELARDALLEKAARHARVCLDVGTGDGRNVYKKAKKDPDTLYIGVDSAAEPMLDTAVKLARRPEKGGLPNVVLAVAAVERLPDDLDALCDRATVLLPWGTLLEWVAKADARALAPMRRAMKPGADFEFVLTYSDAYEPAEIERRALPALCRDYLVGPWSAKLLAAGFSMAGVEALPNAYAKAFDSAWAKKLAFGRARTFWRVTGTVT